MSHLILHRIYRLLPIAGFMMSGIASAQAAADQIALGNREYNARNAPLALERYKTALARDPRNYEALWRAALAGLEVGEYAPQEQKFVLYDTAAQHARLAVQLDPAAAEGHYVLARALGEKALAVGVRERIRYATEIHDQALACLRIRPNHAGCLHVMGVWNAEVMRLNSFSRTFAQRFLGGTVFGEASWDEAQRYMTAAVSNEPNVIIHRLDLGRIYADRGMKAEAKREFLLALKGELGEYNDAHYKAEAASALKEL